MQVDQAEFQTFVGDEKMTAGKRVVFHKRVRKFTPANDQRPGPEFPLSDPGSICLNLVEKCHSSEPFVYHTCRFRRKSKTKGYGGKSVEIRSGRRQESM